MLENKLPPEFAERWKWRSELSWKQETPTEGTLVGKDFDEVEGWAGSARHGVMRHTWGN